MQSAIPKSAQAYGDTDKRKAPTYLDSMGVREDDVEWSWWCWELGEAYIKRFAAAGKQHIYESLLAIVVWRKHGRTALISARFCRAELACWLGMQPFPICFQLTSSNDGQARPYAANAVRQAHVCDVVVFVEK